MQNILTRQFQPKNTKAANCHGEPQMNTAGLPLVVIVGSPNVGKSVLFNTLTGIYATVSNYPGTTVEVTRGKSRFGSLEAGVMDTPGMYGLLPITEEERVARKILLSERADLVIHVVDAKNIERMLPMTLQLMEAGLPVMLVVNLMDEAERIGIQVSASAIQQSLGIPVLGTALARGQGAKELRETIINRLAPQPECGCNEMQCSYAIRYLPTIQSALLEIESRLTGDYRISKREIALLLLQNDSEVAALVQKYEPEQLDPILNIVRETQKRFNQPVSYLIASQQREEAKLVLEPAFNPPSSEIRSFGARLSDAMIRPLTGLPLLFLILFLLYEFVGVLGAQILVNFLEADVFGAHINPWINQVINQTIPWPVVRDLLGGPFGMITLGVRYAVAIVLPIVGTFFLAFSVIEDSGYLPRLALLIDRAFKKIGLNGRAVIPIVLGFGCDTMATIVTRTLETPRERLLSTLLLSLAIPCSAQLGVMLGLLYGRLDLLLIWLLVVIGVFLLVGFLAAKLVPGERPTFYMELPPLRLPTARNVFVKTYTRMEWYLREVFPLFIIASVLIWFGRLIGLFDILVHALEPLMIAIGLPKTVAVAFLFGFFRRDYGAAGLYDLRSSMNAAQLLVATVTMTLFMPCIAQLSITVKERGWKTALAMSAFIFPFALLVGWSLNLLLKILPLNL